MVELTKDHRGFSWDIKMMCNIYIYIIYLHLPCGTFSAVAPKGVTVRCSCKEKHVLQKKTVVKNVSVWSDNVAVWSGNVAVWSGNVAVAKSYIWNYSENLKKHPSAKKNALSENIFFEQKAEI